MNINSSDIKFLKQLNEEKTLVANIANLNATQIKYKLKKINYLLHLLNHSEIDLDDLGYIVSNKKSVDYLISNFDGLIYSKEARLNHIIMLLLKQNYVSKKEIQDLLQCSKSTVKNDFLELKTLLKKFNISLKYIHKFGFILDGKEKKIRDFFLNHYMLNFDFFRKKIILEKAQTLMFDILKGQNSSFETSKIISILLSIQYYRILHKNYIDSLSLKTLFFFDASLTNNFSYINDISESADDLEFENIFFEFYLNNLIYNKEQPISGTTSIFTNSLEIFIRNVENSLKLRLSNDIKLKNGLNNHIKALFFKKNNSIPVNKVDLESFKKEFHSLYKAVHDQSKIFKNNFKIRFEDGDLLYISYHFLSAVNRYNKKKTKKILIVCNKGIGASKILEEKLKILFYVKIVDNLSFYEYQMYEPKDIDIIIHTIDDIKCDFENIKVAPFISKVDEARIEKLGCFRK